MHVQSSSCIFNHNYSLALEYVVFWIQGFVRKGRGSMPPPPYDFFHFFFINSMHELLAHTVYSSCLIIYKTCFGKMWGESVAMVTIYDVM